MTTGRNGVTDLTKADKNILDELQEGTSKEERERLPALKTPTDGSYNKCLGY